MKDYSLNLKLAFIIDLTSTKDTWKLLGISKQHLYNQLKRNNPIAPTSILGQKLMHTWKACKLNLVYPGDRKSKLCSTWVGAQNSKLEELDILYK